MIMMTAMTMIMLIITVVIISRCSDIYVDNHCNCCRNTCYDCCTAYSPVYKRLTINRVKKQVCTMRTDWSGITEVTGRRQQKNACARIRSVPCSTLVSRVSTAHAAYARRSLLFVCFRNLRYCHILSHVCRSADRFASCRSPN